MAAKSLPKAPSKPPLTTITLANNPGFTIGDHLRVTQVVNKRWWQFWKPKYRNSFVKVTDSNGSQVQVITATSTDSDTNKRQAEAQL